MTQQPDNLFREKLEHFQLNPSTDAWNRIEAGLTKRANKMLWMKIAAGLVLLSVASIILWNNSMYTDQHTTAIVNQDIGKENLAVETTPADIPATSNNLITKEKDILHSAISGKRQKVVVKEYPQLEVVETIQEEAYPVVETVVSETLIAQTEVAPTELSSGIYLVYSAEEVNQKYLRQQPEEDATSEEKKSSRMQMLMSVANNLKNGENPLGDLRQMKDEIFALNFIDEKKQQTKKN